MWLVEARGARGWGESATLLSTSPPPLTTTTTASKRPSLGLRMPSEHLVTEAESSRHESRIYWRRRKRRQVPPPPPWEPQPRAELALEFSCFFLSSRKRESGRRSVLTLSFFFGRERRRNSAALSPSDALPLTFFDAPRQPSLAPGPLGRSAARRGKQQQQRQQK